MRILDGKRSGCIRPLSGNSFQYYGLDFSYRCVSLIKITFTGPSFSGIRCGDIKRGDGTLVTDQTGDSYEDSVTMTCRPGYHMVTGSTLRTCLAGRSWSGTPLVCART